MKKKSRVYIVTECPYVGIFRGIIELSKELKSLGFSLTYIFPKTPRNRYGEKQVDHEKELRKYGQIIRKPLRRKLFFLAGDVRCLKSYFLLEKPDIVISYTEYAGKVCRILRNIGSIDNLYHTPSCVGIKRKSFWFGLLEYFFEKLLSTSADYYLACGPSECFILNQKFKISPEKIVFLPDLRIFKKVEERVDKYLFIYVGRIVKDKGVFELLKSFKMLNLLKKVVFVGDGRELKKLKKLYPEVEFTGRVEPERVFHYLSVSKYFISNSVVEGMPYSLVEAMSMGTVPIVSNVEGHMDLILNGFNGFLFNNQLELMNTIFKVQLLDNKIYNSLSSNAKKSSNNLLKLAKISIKNNFKKYD
jgi:glycosyltransferase involved in cell wall biosynthesis